MRASVFVSVVAVLAGVQASAATLVGRWDLENNLNPTTGSAPLAAGVTPVTYQPVTINGQSGTAAVWPQGTRAANDEQFFTITNPIGANGGGTATNQYSLVMDVNFAAPGGNDGYTSLAQTATDPHGNDGDLFVRDDGGAGISGDYSDTGNALRFPYGQWVRIVWTVDTATAPGAGSGYRVYFNGQLHNVVQSPSGWGVDGRFSLGNVLHVFADEDGETNAGSLSTLMLYNGALTADEVAALGGPEAAAVPEPAACGLALLGAVPLLARRRR